MNRFLAILLLLILPAGVFAQGYSGYSLTGTNINITTNGTYWTLYTAGDYTDGAWFIDRLDSNIVMNITLPSTLAAGVWKFQFKCGMYDNVEDFSPATFTLGGGSNSAPLSDRGTSLLWLPSMIRITNSVATNLLTISYHNTNNVLAKMLVHSLYWTTNLNEEIDSARLDQVWDYTYPAAASASVATTNNILVTSSFEAGIGGWQPNVVARTTNINEWVKSGDSQHGNWALKILDAADYVVSPQFKVKPDSRNHSLSLYYKGSGSVRIKTAFDAPSGYSNTVNSSYTLGSVGSWTRFSTNLTLYDYPVAMPYVIQLTGASNTLFDAIMVHEGTNLAPFATMGNLELGWSNSVTGGIYYTNETSKPYITAYNSSGGTRSVVINYEFVNHNNSTVLTGSITNSMADGGRINQAITLPTNPGWYRASCWSDGVSPKEVVLIHMPSPPSGTNHFVASHNGPTIWQTEQNTRLGISDCRAMSPIGALRWDVVEATEGVFVYYDTWITNASALNTHVLGGLVTTIPSYAGTYATVDLTKWSNYVYTVVNRYKTLVNEWEIGNEITVMPFNVYTNFLKNAVWAARAADSTAKICGLGGCSSGTAETVWREAVLAAFGNDITNWCNALSIHTYPSGSDPYSQADSMVSARYWKTNVVTRFGGLSSLGLKIYNTESGHQDYGGAVANLNPYVVVGGGIFKHSHMKGYLEGAVTAPYLLSQHDLAYKAFGFDRIYNYDSRVITDGIWIAHHYTALEMNDFQKPKMAAQAIVNYMVEGTTGGGEFVLSNTNIVLLYFENGNNSRAAVWTVNGSNTTMTCTNILPYDWLLTPKTVTASSHVINRFPTYLLPSGLTSSQFKQNLTNASYVVLADTFAPKVSIAQFPGTSINDTNLIYAKFTAVDDYSLPSNNAQETLQTRYALILTSATIQESDYSAWSTTVDHRFTGADIGTNVNRTLYVQGRDAAGNSNTVTRVFGASAAATLSAITIVATDSTATEAGPTTGYYTITRDGSTAVSLPVYFTVSGTATSGTDYTSIGTSATILAGQTTVTVTVTPIDDLFVESDETVIVTLSADAAYTVGSPDNATVTITSDDQSLFGGNLLKVIPGLFP